MAASIVLGGGRAAMGAAIGRLSSAVDKALCTTSYPGPYVKLIYPHLSLGIKEVLLANDRC